jgi:basic membrane lipoprotein Med (substrate-binding protein (PBP1-ABC) superfamily)
MNPGAVGVKVGLIQTFCSPEPAANLEKTLAAAGHEIICPVTGDLGA